MTYEINTAESRTLNWSARGDERILQNVYNLISTSKYEVAYARLLGLDPSVIDKPSTEAVGLITAQIIDQVERFEPRAQVLHVEIIHDELGDMKIKVAIEI